MIVLTAGNIKCEEKFMIACRLRALRKSKGITQNELADILGVRKAAISLYETDQCDPADSIKISIAKYFDVSLDYLVGVIDDEVKYYTEENFVKLPENITAEEKELAKKFIDYIAFLRK